MKKQPCSVNLFTALCFTAMLLPVCAFGLEPEVAKPSEKTCRIVSWNIELVGERGTPRTDEQLAAVAERMGGFNGSIHVLQEIYDLEILQHIVDEMPGEWDIFYPGNEHAIVYDPNQVRMVRGSIMNPETAYPGKSSSVPVMSVFRAVGIYAEPFMVVSIHCKANSPSTQTEEGLWIAERVGELQGDPDEVRDIILIGDTNGEPDAPPDVQLLGNGLLMRLANEDITDVRDRCVDHCYATGTAYEKFPLQSAMIVGPDFYSETNSVFRETYSDHYPVIVDFKPDSNTDMRLFAPFAKHWLQTGCKVGNDWCGGMDTDYDGQVALDDLAVFVMGWCEDLQQ